MYEMYETLLKTCFCLKWGVNQVSRGPGSPDREFDPRFGPFTPILTHFGHFWALPLIGEVYNVWNTNRKVGLAVILRGITTSYDHSFLRYCNFVIFLGVVAMSHQKKPMRGHFPSVVYDINDENLCFRSNDNFLAGSDKNLAKNMLELTTLRIARYPNFHL